MKQLRCASSTAHPHRPCGRTTGRTEPDPPYLFSHGAARRPRPTIMSNPAETLPAPQALAQRKPRRRLRKIRGLGLLTHGDLTRHAAKGFRNGFGVLGLLMVAGAISLGLRRPDYLLAFVSIGLAALVPVACWVGRRRKGVPVLAVFAVQQATIYLAPLYSESVSLQGYSADVMVTSAFGIVLFLLLLPLGWWAGVYALHLKPSHWNMSLAGSGGGRAKAMTIALTLLMIGIVFELLTFTGSILTLVPTAMAGFVPVLRTFASASEALGAMLGGFAVAGPSLGRRAFFYWALLAVISILSISGVLLSAATALIVAAAIGQAFGRRRLPWAFLGVAIAIAGFLNLGKFTMRDRYWEKGTMTPISLAQLPGHYAEWGAASIAKLRGDEGVAGGRDVGVATDEKGQSLLERIDNYQNMAFVVNAQQVLHTEPLAGEGYTLIPPLFIPRFLWADKPRTHEGQILLNLHYGRQGSVEDTEKTYIAWGLLPEAVGNFGIVLGPIILGPLLGFFFGLLEAWSVRKRLFAVEGMIAAALVLQVLVSFEMAMSVLLTSTFQMVVAVGVGASILRLILGSGGTDGVTRSRPSRRNA